MTGNCIISADLGSSHKHPRQFVFLPQWYWASGIPAHVWVVGDTPGAWNQPGLNMGYRDSVDKPKGTLLFLVVYSYAMFYVAYKTENRVLVVAIIRHCMPTTQGNGIWLLPNVSACPPQSYSLKSFCYHSFVLFFLKCFSLSLHVYIYKHYRLTSINLAVIGMGNRVTIITLKFPGKEEVKEKVRESNTSVCDQGPSAPAGLTIPVLICPASFVWLEALGEIFLFVKLSTCFVYFVIILAGKPPCLGFSGPRL